MYTFKEKLTAVKTLLIDWFWQAVLIVIAITLLVSISWLLEQLLPTRR